MFRGGILIPLRGRRTGDSSSRIGKLLDGALRAGESRHRMPDRRDTSSRDRLDVSSSSSHRTGRPVTPVVGNHRIENFPAGEASIAEKVDPPRIIVQILESFFNHDAFASWTVHSFPPPVQVFM